MRALTVAHEWGTRQCPAHVNFSGIHPIAEDHMPDPTTPDAPATHLQLIRIASRLFAAYMLFWAADDLTLMPRPILSLSRYLTAAPEVRRIPDNIYFMRIYGLEVSTFLLRIALLLLAAGWFYRCGPRIQRFFSPETDASAIAPVSNPEP